MTPPRSLSELVVAAQNDGWHLDPLGKEIISELVRRQQVAARPKQIIVGLSVALAMAVGALGLLYAQNAQLSEKAAAGSKAAAMAETTANERSASARAEAAAERARAIAAEKQIETITAALNGQQAAVVKQFTEQLNAAERENSRLRDEVATWKAAAAKATKP